MDGNWKRLKGGSGLCFCKSEAGMTEVGRQGGKSRGTKSTKVYQLSHQGSPRILEWVAYPFSSNLVVEFGKLSA